MEDNILDSPYYFRPKPPKFTRGETGYWIFVILSLCFPIFYSKIFLIGCIYLFYVASESLLKWNYTIYKNRIEFHYLFFPNKKIYILHFKDIQRMFHNKTTPYFIQEKSQFSIELQLKKDIKVPKKLLRENKRIFLLIPVKEDPKKVEELIDVLQQQHPNFIQVGKDLS